MSGPGDGDEDDEGDGADPVWFDWQTISGPGDFTLTGLPEGDWVVIVSIGCEDRDTGDEYGAMNIDGPWSLYNTTFANDTTTSMSVDLQIMDEGGPDEGDGMDYETGVTEFSISVEDAADGYTSLTMITKIGMSDFLRADVDCGFGNCDGEVDASEAASAISMLELIGPAEDCPFDDSTDSPCNAQACEDPRSTECLEYATQYCANNSDDPGCDGRGDDGPPPFMWNGVLLTEEDIISDSKDIVGLIGMVPVSEADDTGGIQLVMTVVFMLNDSGAATQIISLADEPDHHDDDGERCPFNPDHDDSPCKADGSWVDACAGDMESQECFDVIYSYCSGEGQSDPGCHQSDEESGDDCDTYYLSFLDSTSWTVSSIDNAGDAFTHDAASGSHTAMFVCERPSENMTVSYTRVVADEPEPPANQPPYCDVYYYAEASDLADFQSTEDKATGSNGTWEVSIVEDDTYWLMFYCTDVDGDSITVNVTSAFGDYGETFAAGSTEGYYELTIPVGSSTLSPYTLAYTWSDGTNSGSGTVTVTVAPADGGSDDSGEETEGEDTSAGSFVPGFTAVLTMTALAGAFLVFSRRED